MYKIIFHRLENGQLSIFLGVSLLIVTTLMAFIVNVGLFVKAKINLQNAVDAAAWSGAAVQARQLSNIAYLNWEMRNTYKEWMFKYYVLGQISLTKTNLNQLNNSADYYQTTPGNMSFRMNPFWKNYDPADKYDTSIYDYYNAPSICIHFGDAHNICELFAVPGIPRFEVVGIPGVGESNEAFLNSIVATKSKDCSDRTILNFSVAMTWAYGTKQSAIIPGAPQIASHRMGAWTQALELGIRMRNLEMFVNRPPVDLPICYSKAGEPCRPVDTLDQEHGEMPINERPIKAFWSAYRNLNEELQQTFMLKELKPTPLQVTASSLSGYLIPTGAQIGSTGTLATEKHYLDLQAYSLNYTTFFTSFVSRGGQLDPTVATEAECASSKTGIPVPGYIFGFVKNPELITYYPVKGEAKFTGLFFPFTQTEGITLKAYAVAKPYGGRIGPRLFNIENQTTIKPRKEATQSRSAPYVSALDVSGIGAFKAGLPMPTLQSFWAKNESDPIGGTPGHQEIHFGIPNLIYDFQTNVSELARHKNAAGGLTIQKLTPATSDGNSMKIHETVGLYDTEQFRQFATNLEDPETLSAINIDRSIFNVRRPTKYESLNYLIPTYENIEAGLDSVSVVNNIAASDEYIQYRLFAPLYGPETLYQGISEMEDVVYRHIQDNESAIDQFLNAINEAAKTVAATPTEDEGESMQAAAASICHWSVGGGSECDSLCGKFNQFFKGTVIGKCGITPLKDAMAQYFADETGTNPGFKKYYQTSYVKPGWKPGSTGTHEETKNIMTGYMPGPRQGATINAVMQHPFKTQNPLISKRNFYSTKLVATDKFISIADPNASYYARGVFLESDRIGEIPSDLPEPLPNSNRIDSSELDEFGQKMDH